MDCITTYYRDDKEMSFEEFEKIFDEDLEKENESLGWDIKGAVYSDWGNGRDVELNGHEYKCRTVEIYDSAKELFDDFMFEGYYDMLFDVLKEMSETEIFNIVSKLKCVDVKDGKLMLKDKNDW